MGDALMLAAILGLAGWRAAAMLSYEVGPWGVFERLRHWLEPEGDEPLGFWAELLACVWCSSVWTTAGFAIVWYTGVPWMRAAVVVIAACAVAVVVERAARR